MRVLALGRREVGGIGIEILMALTTIMLRVGQGNIPRTSRNEIPDIVQCAGEDPIAIAALAAMGAMPMREVATLLDHAGLGQIFWAGNPFRGIRTIRSGTKHRRASLAKDCLPRSYCKRPKKA